jgi:hypothetical protein
MAAAEAQIQVQLWQQAKDSQQQLNTDSSHNSSNNELR